MNFASAIRKLWPSRSWRPWPSDRGDRQAIGGSGETEAVRYLRRKRRHRIIARNYDCPAGEIDLITTDGPTIVFVEVKSRTQEAGKDADQTVLPVQRERIVRAARFFLRQARAEARPSRFDVVTVYFPSCGRPVVEHFENAFVA